ncbi:hypothetical protein V5O48_000718 [Marasmius crinis-equi]|uniref:F-box domain-containing protein n=1 Tax=Marasmius crinis-equi TaxID=585013 RepID=A0ABR3G122_9AGAR
MDPQSFTTFPFSRLPFEISLLAIDHASRPNFDAEPANPRLAYIDALSISLVCRSFRKIAMKNLLHTIIFVSDAHVRSFVDSIRLQRRLRSQSSDMALDYSSRVRHVYASNIWGAMMSQTADNFIDCLTLHEVMRDVVALSLTFDASHILHDGFQHLAKPDPYEWKCRRLVLTGSHVRWLPFTSSRAGMSFLSRITQLALWVPYDESPFRLDSPVPPWARQIPFHALSSLSNLAFPLWSSLSDDPKVDFYIITPRGNVSDALEKWAKGDTSAVSVEKLPLSLNCFRHESLSIWDSPHAHLLTEQVWREIIDRRCKSSSSQHLG